MDNTINLLSSVHEPVLEAIHTMQESGNIDLARLAGVVNDSKHCLDSFSTQHKRHKLFEKTGWVKPVTVIVGTRSDTGVLNGQAVQKSVPISYQYVPLLSTIRLILSNRKIKQLLLQSRSNQSSTISSFLDGTKCQELTRDESSIHLVLALYCDDIEVANPLGANSGVHKLTMYYFSILNLPQEMLSATAHIHLVAVGLTEDVKAVGHNSILSRFVKELKLLQVGTTIHDDFIRGSLGIVCADNLAANSIINMCESFNADHYCRFCVIHRDEARILCSIPDPQLLRTKKV